MKKLEDFIDYAQKKGFYSAYFLTTFKGEDLYCIQKYKISGLFTGEAIVLKEKNNRIVELTQKEKDEYSSSLPDEDE